MPNEYTKEAEKLLHKKKVAITSPENPDAQEWTEIESYNKAREEDLPIVADLLKQIDEQKKNNECYTCGSLDDGPRYCIECYSKLEKEIEEGKDE